MIERTMTLPDPPKGYRWSDAPRRAQAGEELLVWGTSKTNTPSMDTEHVYFVLEPVWEHAGLFRPGWVARDGNGTVYWYAGEPVFREDKQQWEGQTPVRIPELITIDFGDRHARDTKTRVGATNGE